MEQSNMPGDEPSGEDAALRRLQDHLDRASGAAERLIAEAARASMSSAGRVAEAARGAAGGDRAKPPPAGWQVPQDDSRAGDIEVLSAVLHSLRDLIPPELQRRVAEALRELLLAVRALIDWYLDRAEERRRAPAEVQDIPIL